MTIEVAGKVVAVIDEIADTVETLALLERLQLLLPRLMVAGTGETRNAQQLISNAGHRRYYDHGEHTFALAYMMPNNSGYAPNALTTADRCSSKASADVEGAARAE